MRRAFLAYADVLQILHIRFGLRWASKAVARDWPIIVRDVRDQSCRINCVGARNVDDLREALVAAVRQPKISARKRTTLRPTYEDISEADEGYVRVNGWKDDGICESRACVMIPCARDRCFNTVLLDYEDPHRQPYDWVGIGCTDRIPFQLPTPPWLTEPSSWTCSDSITRTSVCKNINSEAMYALEDSGVKLLTLHSVDDDGLVVQYMFYDERSKRYGTVAFGRPTSVFHTGTYARVRFDGDDISFKPWPDTADGILDAIQWLPVTTIVKKLKLDSVRGIEQYLEDSLL